MGIHLDPNVLGVVSTIQSHMPIAAVLASATLGPWEGLEQWWRGPVEARQITISLEPYDLPMSTLHVWSEEKSSLAPISPLGIFDNYAEFQRIMKDAHAHAPASASLQPPGERSDGHQGSRRGVEKIQGDVKSLRLAVEPIFKGLSYADFTRLKKEWATGRARRRSTKASAARSPRRASPWSAASIPARWP